MKVDITLDQRKVEQQGYTVDAVRQTVKQNFAAKGFPCMEAGERMSFAGHGGENDFSELWSILMALLRTEWFTALASSCIWHDDDGTQEDVLSQAWKVQGRKLG